MNSQKGRFIVKERESHVGIGFVKSSYHIIHDLGKVANPDGAEGTTEGVTEGIPFTV